jgi:hypothetical protein
MGHIDNKYGFIRPQTWPRFIEKAFVCRGYRLTVPASHLDVHQKFPSPSHTSTQKPKMSICSCSPPLLGSRTPATCFTLQR